MSQDESTVEKTAIRNHPDTRKRKADTGKIFAMSVEMNMN